MKEVIKMNDITLNFKNIISELENKELKLCFLKNRIGIFIEDSQKNLYDMETYWSGSYLDKLIKNGITVNYNLVDTSISKNIENWEKEIWEVTKVKAFMKRQSL